jgi:hypothetical protein
VGKGLLLYYFPRKVDILQTLLDERLPEVPSSEVTSLSRPDDIAGSLTRLARRLDLAGHHAVALRSIIFREAGTHREAREHAGAFRTALHELTERVLDAASPVKLNARRRREAAQIYVAVMLDEANARRLGAPGPDIASAARIVAASLNGPSYLPRAQRTG